MSVTFMTFLTNASAGLLSAHSLLFVIAENSIHDNVRG